MQENHKIALVTGSARGIGRAIAETLSADGYEVIVHCLNSTKLAEEVVGKINEKGGKAYLVTGDISTESGVKSIFEQITKITNKLDLLVNNAAIDYGLLIENYDFEKMRKVIDVTLLGTMVMTLFALPFLKKGAKPSIVNISSRMGKEKTIKTIGAYGPAKAGVNKFTQCCALEFAPYKIRVNCVAPGLTDTILSRTISPDQGFWDKQAELNPRGRVGQPQDIANTVSFLASDKADYINGETVGVNGGSTLG